MGWCTDWEHMEIWETEEKQTLRAKKSSGQLTGRYSASLLFPSDYVSWLCKISAHLIHSNSVLLNIKLSLIKCKYFVLNMLQCLRPLRKSEIQNFIKKKREKKFEDKEMLYKMKKKNNILCYFFTKCVALIMYRLFYLDFKSCYKT